MATPDEDNVLAKKVSKPEHGNTREPLTILKGHREAVSGVHWMDFKTVLSSGWDHLLNLWDCDLGGIKQEIAGIESPVIVNYINRDPIFTRASERVIMKCRVTIPNRKIGLTVY